MNIIYMAAGNGRRFAESVKHQGKEEENKLLYPYKGKALYRHTLDRILETGEAAEIYVVSQYPQLLEEIKELPVTPVYSPRSKDGASFTIQAGLAAAGMGEGCAFFAADQPELSGNTIFRFLAEAGKDPEGLLAVGRGKDPGNPCYFGCTYPPELLELTGDQGGKRIIRKYKERCKIVEAKRGELADVDVIGQLSVLNQV